jgi:hypothetical protein
MTKARHHNSCVWMVLVFQGLVMRDVLIMTPCLLVEAPR